jgi:hypothetical protein
MDVLDVAEGPMKFSILTDVHCSAAPYRSMHVPAHGLRSKLPSFKSLSLQVVVA